jgi:HEAT repeat protein
MKKSYPLLLSLLLVSLRISAQSSAVSSLEQKVEAELEIVDFDTAPPYMPLEKRLLKLGNPEATSHILVSLLQKYKDARTGLQYRYLLNSVRAVGKFQEHDALPLLTKMAEEEGTSDVKLLALLSIGEIDPKGAKELLLSALRDREYSVRRVAAEGLARIDDQSVLYELEVAASQERSPEASSEIQGFANVIRARIRSGPR